VDRPRAALIRARGPQVVDVRRDGTVPIWRAARPNLGQSVEIVRGSRPRALVVSPPDGLKEGMRVAAEEPTR